MHLPHPQVTGTLVKRYKRFLADIVLDDGTTTTVHCPNSGSMMGLVAPGNKVWCHVSPNPHRKLPLTLDYIEVAGVKVGVNTQYPNALVAEALQQGRIPELAGYPLLRREVTVAKGTRLDLCLQGHPSQSDVYIEVKNVTLKEQRGDDHYALFPDAVTERGTKHLHALMACRDQGYRSALVFVVQRQDVTHFAPAETIDPVYAAALRKAVAHGVEVYCHACIFTPNESILGSSITLNI